MSWKSWCRWICCWIPLWVQFFDTFAHSSSPCDWYLHLFLSLYCGKYFLLKQSIFHRSSGIFTALCSFCSTFWNFSSQLFTNHLIFLMNVRYFVIHIFPLLPTLAYLLNHSKTYTLAFFISLMEFWLESLFFIKWKLRFVILGFILVVGGQVVMLIMFPDHE